MCQSCASFGLNRREFLATAGAFGAAAFVSRAMAAESAALPSLPWAKMNKKPARVMVAFLYPPADVVNEGKMEDGWAPHNWFTWPGNQFEPEQQQG